MKYYNNWVKKLCKIYGNGSLNNIQIDNMGREFLKESYGSCEAADTFVNYIKYNQKGNGKCYIVNIQNSDQKGSHWIAFIDDKDELLAYDSYGTNIDKYNKLFKELIFREDTSDREQRYNNEFDCGSRALAACITYKNLGKKCFLLI